MSSSKNWELKINESVYGELKKFPKKRAEKIARAIESLSFDPYSGDIQKIKGEKSLWRRRVGKYRVFYEIDKTERIIYIFWVEHRASKTY